MKSVRLAVLMTGVLITATSVVAISFAGAANALTAPKVTWKKSSLLSSTSYVTSALATSNSSGTKVWSVSGSCILRRSKITTLDSGSCTVRLAVKATSKFAAKTYSKRFPITENTTSTTVNTSPVQSTTTTQITTTTIVVPNVCTGSSDCNLGDTGPGGGIVFYIAPAAFTSTGSGCARKCMYLEAAPQSWGKRDLVCTAYDGPVTVDPQCGWSGSRGIVLGAAGTAIGTGNSNTTAIIKDSNVANKAATSARAYAGGGKTDWSLPSKSELNELCKYAKQQPSGATAMDCAGSGILRPGFSAPYYWSSTSSDANYAWIQDFSNGLQQSGHKNGPYYVRPVRAF